MVVLGVVFKQILDINLGEVSYQTSLHIFNFLGHNFVLVIVGGFANKSLIEHGLKERVEVAHETSVVTKFVLDELGSESHVTLLSDGGIILVSNLGASSNEFNSRECCQTPEEAHNTLLETDKTC